MREKKIKNLIVWVCGILVVALAIYQIFIPSFENISEKNILQTKTVMQKYMDIERTVGEQWYDSGTGSYINPRNICYYIKVEWKGEETFSPIFDAEGSIVVALKMGDREVFPGVWKKAPMEQSISSSFGNVAVCLGKYFMGDKGKIMERVRSNGDIWFYDYGHSVALIDNSRKIYETIQVRFTK